ncbi:hypothetical protein GCM10023264_09120 [Sphingomonas daechungensis]|uniref:DUF4402 domain-containing protein n=1 Tax=Sphingomonas daechungensis TaxID=1176646 RepID=A0ABX6T0V2_9SPHN|nr:DUF4402 domain-containing protein [Sphingomonas daechungensis]QNP43194.1 DUF4402 domain-containing protein [Sphingomonas daechungensis]
MRLCKLLIAAGLAASATPAVAAPVAPPQPATGRALILVPLQLTKIDDLSFGTVVPSPLSGAVSVNATTGNRTTIGGVTGVASDPGNRGYFATAGSPNQQVIVTITQPLALDNGLGDTIPVLALTLDGPNVRTIDPVTRNFFFGVGGIIFVNANQPEGLYQATFDVTATYL